MIYFPNFCNISYFVLSSLSTPQKGYVLCMPTNICPGVTEIKVQLMLVEMLEHR
jgi:hypothetical protein